jgi:MoxR-like ATPase
MASKKVLSTVVAANSSVFDGLTPGDEVTLQRDLGNSHDPDAWEVFSAKGKIGYIANSANTLAPATMSATELCGATTETAIAGIIEGQTIVKDKNGKDLKAVVLSFVLSEKMAAPMAEEEEELSVIRFPILGGDSLYPNKKLLVDLVDSGETPTVTFVKGKKLTIEFQGGAAGYVGPAMDDLVGPEKVLALMEGDQTAIVVGRKGRNLIAEMKLSAKAEILAQLLTKAIADAIARGVLTQEEIDERIAYLKKVGCTERQIAGVLNGIQTVHSELSALYTKPKTMYADESQSVVRKAVAAINVGRNLMMSADRGVGKNTLVNTLAWVYKRPQFKMSLNSNADTMSLTGGKTIRNNEDGKQEIVFETEPLIKAMELGAIAVLDEFNMGVPSVMSLINSIFDDNRELNVPGYRHIQATEGFFGIATMNKDYQGTFATNEASSDRFFPIKFPKLKSIEGVLKAKYPDIDQKVLQVCNRLFKAIKHEVELGHIAEAAVTIRGFIDAVAVLEQDITLKEALQDSVAARAIDSAEEAIINNMIDDILA